MAAMQSKFKDGVPAQYEWARRPRKSKAAPKGRSRTPSPTPKNVKPDPPTPVVTRADSGGVALHSAGRAIASSAPVEPAAPKFSAQQPRKSTIKALRKPKPFVPPSASRPPLRPSLKDQLSAIASAAGSLTEELTAKHKLSGSGLEEALLVVPSRTFEVGRLESKYPSTVRFQHHRCVYQFHHPFERKQIDMEMYYSDMTAVAVQGLTLRFKVARPLAQFGDDYRFQDRRHTLSIAFASQADATAFKTKVLPVIRQFSRK